MSNFVNKVKDALHSDKSSAPEGTAGPHSSRAANAADPRIDSDMDHSHNAGMRKTAGHGELGSSGVGNTMGSSTMGSSTMGSSTMGSNTYGSSNTGRTAGNTMGMGSSGMSEGATGPHSSRMANAADPRVDSDRDGSRTMGGNTMGSNTGRTAGGLGSSGNTFGSSNTYGAGPGPAQNTAGPHSSDMANKFDPRVDSDLDGSNTMGNTGNTGRTTGGLGTSGNTFGSSNTHGTTGNTFGSSNTHGTTGNTFGSSNTHGTSTGTHGTHGLHSSGPGPAHNTAGPHSSDMANKLDPRVDSDMDGSKTLGQNKTYQSGTQSSGLTGRHVDPTDAAQVPPSVLQQHIGPPTIEHDHTNHGRERRNSIKTHQETYSGI